MRRLITCLIYVSFFISAANAAAIESVSLTAGGGDISSKLVQMNLTWKLDIEWSFFKDSGIGTLCDIGLGRWSWRHDEHSTDISLTPMLFWQYKSNNGKWLLPYVEAGIGVHLLKNVSATRSRLTTSFEFGTIFGAGVRLINHLSIGYRFQHLSNAGIKEPNTGINVHLVKISYRF